MTTKTEALKMALKNLLVATKHLDVCPGTVQAAEEALAQPEQALQRHNDYMAGFNEGYDRATKQSLAQPEPVMDYDKEELRNTVWDTNKQSLAQPEQEPLEYWNAVEGWVKIDEVRKHFDSVGCGTIYKTAGEDRTPLYTSPPAREWVGLNWGDLPEEWVGDTKFLTGARWAEEILEKKNA
jgi:hypothetical protein